MMAVSLAEADKRNVSWELYKTSVESNDFKTAFKLMSSNYDDIKCVELRNHSTPLHYACLYGNIRAVETLVKTFRLGIEDKDDNGCTALSLAVQCGYFDIFKLLLQYTLDKNFAVSAEPCSSLSRSLKLAFQEKLVKCNSDKNQNNLLYQATIHGQSEIVKFLCKNLDFDGTNLHEIKELNSLYLFGGTVPVIKFKKNTPSQVHAMYEYLHMIKSMERNSICHSVIKELLLIFPLHASCNIIKLLSRSYHCNTEILSHTKSTPLHVAAIHGQLEVMKCLINNFNFDPNIVGVHGKTALYYACSSGHHEVVKYLIEECQCNKDTRFEKDTLLHITVAHGHLDLVKYFVEYLNIGVNIQGLKKWTPLFHAVQNGHHNIIKYLIETCHCDASMRDEYNVAPIHIAAIYGHLDIVKYFIKDLDINSNIPGFNKWTPLHYASQNGHYFIIKFLIDECHCNPNIRNKDNETPLHYVVRNGHLNLVKYFVEKLSMDTSIQGLNRWTLVHYACQNGHLDIIKYLIENGHCAADTSNIDNALHFAVLYGQLDLEKYFIEDLNMDSNIQSLEQCAPLHVASVNGDHNIIKCLIENYHCNVDIRNMDNYDTLLYIATDLGHLDLVRYFVDVLNMDPNTQGFEDRAPLHHACAKGHHHIVRYLVENCHCNPDIRNKYNNTPLHIATLNGHLDLVKYFVEDLNMDLNPREFKEWAPLHHACANGHHNIVRYLVENCHCNADIRSEDNDSPLHIAALNGHLDLVKYFVEDLNMDPNTQGFQECAPFYNASENGHHNIVRYWVKNCHYNAHIRSEDNNISASNGHLDLGKYFLEDFNMDPNPREVKEWAPLHHVSAKGHHNIAKYLVEKCDCNPGTKSEDNNTPLHIAALNGHLNLVKYFVENSNMDPNSRGFEDWAPLHFASANGHRNIVRYLVKNCHCNVDIRSENSDTPLHIAALNGHLDLVKYFVENSNMNPNTRGFQQCAPLHHASANGHCNIVRYLIKNCLCNAGIKSEDNNMPLHIAALNGQLDLVKYFVENLKMDPNTRGFKEWAPLHFASANGHCNIVRYLIQNCHCKAYIKTENKDTLLHIAAFYGHLDLVKYFVEDLNMNPNTRGFQESAPLYQASDNGHHNIVRYKVENCHCSADIRNKYNNTPLHIAALNGHLDLVKYFVEVLNMDLDARGFKEWGILHHACDNGHHDIVRYLVQNHHCKVDIRSEDHSTPLHIAALNGHLCLVKYFVEVLEVDVETRGIFKQTPLHYASQNGHYNIVKYLIENRCCDVNIKNEAQLTPLHLATSNGHLNVVKYYIEFHKVLDFCISHSEGFTDEYANLYFFSNKSLLFHAARNGHTDIFRYICNYCRLDPELQHNYTDIQNVSNEDTLHSIRTYVDPLHEAAINGDLDKVKHYIESKKWSPLLQDRHGNNVLHKAAQYGHLEVIKYLLSSIKLYSKLLIRNKLGFLPEEIALKNDFCNVASYIELISNKTVKIKHLPFIHTILVIGNSSSGKSTLTKSIMNKNSWLGRYRKVHGVAPSTAGVVPHFIEDDEIGSLTIYDFAGHEEYYASHEKILQHFMHPLILIVVDISLPILVIKEQLSYWVTIIQNSTTQQIISLLIIASHIDICKDKINCTEANKFMEAMISENSLAMTYHGILECDCRYSGSTHMRKVLIKIGEMCRKIHISNLKDESKEATKLCSSFRTYLVENKMKLSPALKLCDIIEKLKQDETSNSNLVELCNGDQLMKTCQLLHFNGCLLFFPDDCCFMDSFLILNENLILDNLHSSLNNINEKIENNIGMIEENELKTIYQSSIGPMDPNAVIKYLIFAQFCTLVSSESLVLSNNLSGIKKNYYFFPNLVKQDRPSTALIKDQDYTESYTWVLKCIGQNQFFTPRCIHNLFIVLASRHLKIDIWKNGILLVNGQFVRSVIEFTDQTRRINLKMQCKKEHTLDLVKERSELTTIIKSLVRMLCPSFTFSESFLYT